ncbi:MAG: hypothetical protein JXB07_21250 [Anaerolineae bacterium]|nr:hypothetical protein [Anaerolineae bacterium]
MFDDVFGFDGAIDFFACSPLDSMYPHPAGRIQGFYATGYQWEPDPSSLLRIVVWTDDDTNLLRGLTFGWVSSESFKVYLSPQRIIRELGKPSYWMLDIFSTERAGKGSLESLMIYENGIVFRHFGVIPIALKVNEAERIFEEANAEFCLDQEYSNVGRVYIFEPFDRGLENLTTVQAYHLQNLLTEEYVVPIQESLGTSIDEVASQALHQDNACFYVDMLKGLYREEK